MTKALRPELGWRVAPLLLRWAVRLRADRRGFLGTNPDPGIEACKASLLPLATLHHQLVAEVGEARAKELSMKVAWLVVLRLQRKWYLPPLEKRGWDAFHLEHERQMQVGLVRHNDHTTPERTAARLEFRITRCRFFEAFTALGTPHLTEAFCHSDEVVFNEYLPSMEFNRGGGGANTIARGAASCRFVFERKEPPLNARPESGDPGSTKAAPRG